MEMTQEEMSALQQKIDLLQRENERLRAFSDLPQPKASESETDFQVDPLILKLRQQYLSLRDANLIFQKVQESSLAVERAFSALLPALEVEFHGMSQRLGNMENNLQDSENTYVSVVEKLEKQVRELRADLASQSSQWQAEKADLTANLKASQGKLSDAWQEIQQLQRQLNNKQ
ncbi:MAG: hypothetical protein AAF206_26840, partial [Bacteroidota bacterium]